jgi:uncharacterized protein YjbI with pentapeptide repeats
MGLKLLKLIKQLYNKNQRAFYWIISLIFVLIVILSYHKIVLFLFPIGSKADKSENFETIKFFTYLIGGILLIWQIILTNRRTKAAQKTADASFQSSLSTLKSIEILEQGQVQERFKNAIEQLGSEKEAVNLGAIYILHHVAKDSKYLRKSGFEILCSYVRETVAGINYPKKVNPSIKIQSTLNLLFIDENEREIYKDLSVNLHNAYLYKADLTNAKLKRANLISANLELAILKNADLSNAEFNNAILKKAIFYEAILCEANFNNTNLREAKMNGANLNKSTLKEADLSSSLLNNTNLNEAVLIRAMLRGAELNEATLINANLTNANLVEAKLKNANLTDAVMKNAILRGANLTGANLTGANLREAMVERAFLINVKLINADLTGAILNEVFLSNSDLSNAKFKDAKLIQADLRNSNLSGARFTTADLSEVVLDDAYVDIPEWIKKLKVWNCAGADEIKSKYKLVDEQKEGKTIYRIMKI